MKTPREFLATHFILSTEDRLAKQDVVALVEARDAEHRAELAAAIDQAAQDACERARVEIGRLNRLLTDQARNCAHRETADRLSNQVESERALRAIDQEEIERLKGELAECEAALKLSREAVQAYCDSENAMREKLAEAKRLLIDANVGTRLPADVREAIMRFLAPPPAESPVPMRCTASAGSCNSPKACREAGRCIDARMREVVGPPAESTPVQSDAFAASLPIATRTYVPAPPDDIGARLERLESEVRYLADTSTQGAVLTLENKVAALETHVHCRACGFILRPENALVADGCPCNSGRGVNHGLVARNTCTCAVCDPAQTGGARKPTALEAKGEPGTHAFVRLACGLCRIRGLPDGPPHHPKGAKP